MLTGPPVYGRACPSRSLPQPESAITTRPNHLLPRRDSHPLAYQRTKAAPEGNEANEDTKLPFVPLVSFCAKRPSTIVSARRTIELSHAGPRTQANPRLPGKPEALPGVGMQSHHHPWPKATMARAGL